MGLPVLLNLENRRCVIVGGGKVGVRQAQKCLQAGAVVIVIGPSLAKNIAGIQYIQARYNRELVLGTRPFLVVAATNKSEINSQIVGDAQQANILTMRVDNPGAADVKGIMSADLGEIQLMAASGTPLLSRYLLDKFSGQITPELLTLAHWLKSLRPHVKRAVASQPDRAALWERIFNSPVMKYIESGDLAAARATLLEILGAELAQHLPESDT
ncbi:MAG: hypothetical protein KJ064_18820 [Anaerolineae bacterium]|nr:hypothetical protein [Anaerolineae bacterium]